MPDLSDMLKLIVPLVVIGSWVMSFLFNKEQQAQAQGQRPRPSPPRVPPGMEDSVARPGGDDSPILVVKHPRTGQDIVIIGGDRAPRLPKPPRPARQRDADGRKGGRAPADKPKPGLASTKVAVPGLSSSAPLGMSSASPSPAPPPAPPRPRNVPATALATSLQSRDKVREAFILAEILKPPLALRPPRS